MSNNLEKGPWPGRKIDNAPDSGAELTELQLSELKSAVAKAEIEVKAIVENNGNKPIEEILELLFDVDDISKANEMALNYNVKDIPSFLTSYHSFDGDLPLALELFNRAKKIIEDYEESQNNTD